MEEEENKRIEEEKKEQEIDEPKRLEKERKEEEWKRQLDNMIKQIIKKYDMELEIKRQNRISILIEKRYERYKRKIL